MYCRSLFKRFQFLNYYYTNCVDSSMMETKLMRSKSQLETTMADMQKYERQRNYLAAQRAKDQSEKLKTQIIKLEKHERKNTQKRDLHDIESFHQEEIQVLENHWKQIMDGLHKEREDAINAQKETHQEERKLIEQEVARQVSEYRGSGAVLSLEQKEKCLAKIKQFNQAKRLQQERNQLISMEIKNWKALLDQKLKNKLKKLETKQDQERKALYKKMEAKIRETMNKRDKQMEQTVRKHKNILRNCKSLHHKENMSSTGHLRIDTMKSLITSRKAIKSPLRENIKSKKGQLCSV